LVDYIRNELKQPGAADCLARGGQASWDGTASLMLAMAAATIIWGLKVDWRDVKGLVQPSSTICTFTGALMQFISDLSKENFDFLKPTDGLFPSKFMLTKHIYDRMQAVHPKTLLCTLPMSTVGDRSLERFKHMVDFVNRSGVDGAAVHLKIKVYHANVVRGDREKSKLNQSDLVELLMLPAVVPEAPRSRRFRRHKTFREVKEEVARRAHQYYDLVVAPTAEGQYKLEDALDLYESFYYLSCNGI
jgi:hypothetical protein